MSTNPCEQRGTTEKQTNKGAEVVKLWALGARGLGSKLVSPLASKMPYD